MTFDQKEIDKIRKEQKEQDILIDKSIKKILEMTFRDWESGIVEVTDKEIKIHSDEVTASDKKINIDGFLAPLTKEQTDAFIYLLLGEMKQYLKVFGIDQLKKIKNL